VSFDLVDQSQLETQKIGGFWFEYYCTYCSDCNIQCSHLKFSTNAVNRAGPKQSFNHAVVPWHEEPIPAVHPKQWLSVAMADPTRSSSDSRSKTVRPGPTMCVASCWLKSQS
jgi:hypothetical protein